jgi:hypothetical protein
MERGRRICSWCRADRGPAETALDTHGICPTCSAREWPELQPRRDPREPIGDLRLGWTWYRWWLGVDPALATAPSQS